MSRVRLIGIAVLFGLGFSSLSALSGCGGDSNTSSVATTDEQAAAKAERDQATLDANKSRSKGPGGVKGSSRRPQ